MRLATISEVSKLTLADQRARMSEGDDLLQQNGVDLLAALDHRAGVARNDGSYHLARETRNARASVAKPLQPLSGNQLP